MRKHTARPQQLDLAITAHYALEPPCRSSLAHTCSEPQRWSLK
jgi:hypothetical protein